MFFGLGLYSRAWHWSEYKLVFFVYIMRIEKNKFIFLSNHFCVLIFSPGPPSLLGTKQYQDGVAAASLAPSECDTEI